ncbi:hypothetical protein BJ166DRAFT_375991 [Pestalotiopsis sp. NC0098]|nr:hypothetical protein BJ166DRAFT_375991 [Pestalotiopsis sp. NC0098]
MAATIAGSGLLIMHLDTAVGANLLQVFGAQCPSCWNSWPSPDTTSTPTAGSPMSEPLRPVVDRLALSPAWHQIARCGRCSVDASRLAGRCYNRRQDWNAKETATQEESAELLSELGGTTRTTTLAERWFPRVWKWLAQLQPVFRQRANQVLGRR